MEEQVLTNEPTIVESTATDTNVATNVETPTVVEQATPMDSNTTYSNLPEPTYNPSMEPVQNLVNDAINIEREYNINNHTGKAMNNFLTNKYDYNKNEAGTYWVAGAINDNNTQMSFLQALINEEMYDDMDLQKFYYDTNLATARAYAAQKDMETAYGFYRAAQEKAMAEGELTGWYMPAEGQYLLGQYTVAQNTLRDPDATPEQLVKAERVTKTTEEWFNANQITTRGIKCLSMLQFEETVRNNTVMAELENEANQIAAGQNAAAAAMADLNFREFKYSVEESEFLAGRDFSYELGLDNHKGYIGHHYDDYDKNITTEGYKDTATMLTTNPTWYNSVLTARGKEYVDNVLKSNGYDAQGYYNYYKDQMTFEKLISEDLTNYKEGSTYKDLNNSSRTVPENEMHKLKVKTKDGEEIYTFSGRAYVKDKYGLMLQITENIEVKDGKNTSTIAEHVTHFTTDNLTYKDKNWYVGDKRASDIVNYNEDGFHFESEKQKKKVKELESKGYTIVQGARSTQGINASVVMKDKDGKFYEVSNKKGEVQEIKESQVKTDPSKSVFDKTYSVVQLEEDYNNSANKNRTYSKKETSSESTTTEEDNFADRVLKETLKDMENIEDILSKIDTTEKKKTAYQEIIENINKEDFHDMYSLLEEYDIPMSKRKQMMLDYPTKDALAEYLRMREMDKENSDSDPSNFLNSINIEDIVDMHNLLEKYDIPLKERKQMMLDYPTEDSLEEYLRMTHEIKGPKDKMTFKDITFKDIGNNINILKEINPRDAASMIGLFEKYNIPIQERTQLALDYPTKDALEEYLRMNEMLGKGR